VDFYGRAYNEKLKKADGSSRLQWISPEGGTSTSVDPVAVLRGAEHPEIAQAFVEFLLSEKGQLLWNNKPGTPNGPEHHAIRRLPIRPDLYTPDRLVHFTDPGVMPYEGEPDFIYNPELTGELFNAMRHAIKVMCIDTHDELTEAWGVLIEHSDENGVMPPRALRNFNEVRLFSYKKTYELKSILSKKGTKKETLRLLDKLNRLAAIFRRSYADSQKLAKQKK
jgi:spermidine/putrescine-binding protein